MHNKNFEKGLIQGDTIYFLKYLIDCCDNMIKNETIKAEFGFTPPMLQLIKMQKEIEYFLNNTVKIYKQERT